VSFEDATVARTILVALSALAVLLPSHAAAATLTFDFTGTVTKNAFLELVGILDQPGAAATGSFSYDTATPNTSPFSEVAWYVQHDLTFTVTFASGASVTSDDLLISVENDNPFVGDVLWVRAEQVRVNGMPVGGNGGGASLQFYDQTGTIFSDAALPPSLSLMDFDSTSGFVTNGVPHFEVLFDLDTITQRAELVPEPATILLLLSGLLPVLRSRVSGRAPY
jgi:hypothetical protein